MIAKIGSNGLDRMPHYVSRSLWYYEVPSGLELYHVDMGKVGVIPWRSIRASLKRKDASAKRKRAAKR